MKSNIRLNSVHMVCACLNKFKNLATVNSEDCHCDKTISVTLRVLLIHSIPDSNTHSHVMMTLAKLIIFNPRFLGGYHLKVVTKAFK